MNLIILRLLLEIAMFLLTFYNLFSSCLLVDESGEVLVHTDLTDTKRLGHILDMVKRWGRTVT